MMRQVSPERQAEFNRLHAYIAHEVNELVGGASDWEISGTDLLKEINQRATAAAKQSPEWPKESLHLHAAVFHGKEVLAAYKLRVRTAQRGRKPNGKRRILLRFERIEATS